MCSVAPRTQNLISRGRPMCDDALNVIYKAVVIAKVIHAIPAWWGFTAASDRQKLNAFIRRDVRLKFYNHNDPPWLNLLMNYIKHYSLLYCITMIMCYTLHFTGSPIAPMLRATMSLTVMTTTPIATGSHALNLAILVGRRDAK